MKKNGVRYASGVKRKNCKSNMQFIYPDLEAASINAGNYK
jgi:hypothetical protein